MTHIQMDALDYNYLLIEYYKKLRISENELSVILMIDHLLSQKNYLITPDLLSLKMNLSQKELDNILVSLIERGFLLFDTGTKIKVSLKPLQKKLSECFQNDLAIEQANRLNKEKSEKIENIRKTFEESLNRNISPLENSLINEWIEHGYSPERIVDAMEECVQKGNKTFKAIDDLLYQWQTRDDIEKAGISGATNNNKWDKNIEETLKIAKAKWIDD